MLEIQAFRLIPVPMHLDDLRWCKSWRQKPCFVFELSEARARAAASVFFSTLDQSLHGSVAGYPWDDLHLVACEPQASVGRASTAAAITDLGGEVINRADYQDVQGDLTSKNMQSL